MRGIRMKKDREYNIWKLIQLNIKQLSKNIGIKFKRECYKFYDRFVLNIDLPDTGYEDLAPEKNIKNGDEYLNALFWAINNENIKNIALTGPYGSGKSSIIQSYLTKHPGTKAINISLATFYCNECQEPVKDDEYEKKIELGILKQLFYKVNSARIPQSRYRKITKKYYKRYLQVVIEIVIALLTGITFLVPDIMGKIYNVINKSSEYYEINFGLSMIIVGIFAIIIILSFTYVLKLCMTRFRVKEVDIADKAKVAVDKDENSIFDKYMDELVYFFEATEYNVVFIEDLDRFDSTKIFVKLRELNSILNNYELIKRKIIFVYAIKDDMFINVERTKFFDFIIPVIPIINSTNSGEILREKLLIKKQVDGTFKSNLYNISSSYISLISPFIEDMRILTSTCNEFIVYKNTLINVNLDDEEMFSMMIFKGLYPKEFSDLEAEKGIVKRAFRDKNLFINSKQRQLESDKKSLEEILNGIKEDIFESVKDVKAALLNYLSGNDAPFVSCEIRAIDYYYDQIMQDNFDMDVFKFQGEIYIEKYNRNNRYRKDLSTDIEVRKYLKRIEYLTNNEDEKKKKIYNKIENINKNINELNTFSLKKLIELYGSKEVLSENVKENKLLVFLLRKGYINENYADYINYFYPNSITLEEMNYIRSIRMQEALGYTHHIKNVELVCDKIENYEFEQKEVLNFDIVDYLITKRSDSEMCDKLFSGLSKDEKEFFEFTKAYFDRKINIDIYIKLLCKHDNKFWEKICNDKLIAEDKKYEYLTYILNNADLDDM